MFEYAACAISGCCNTSCSIVCAVDFALSVESVASFGELIDLSGRGFSSIAAINRS